MKNSKPKLAIVVPCYNEEEVLAQTTGRLTAKLKSMINNELISKDSYILYVNDGSKDKTWSIIQSLNGTNEFIAGLSLSRNRGHQNALLAGLMDAKDKSDITISIDADLQDDIDVLDDFVKKYIDGADIVYGVRSKRKTDSAFKRITAEGFYKIMELFGVEVVFNHADYRLMSKRALNDLSSYKEVNLFLRGIVPTIGYKTDIVTYERHERLAGESKYPLKKMFNLALDGITSFTVKPIRMIFSLGLIILAVSTLLFLGNAWAHGFRHTWIFLNFIPWSIWFVCGLQMVSLGIVGEYVGKAYMEIKQRPRYFVAETLAPKNAKKNLRLK